MSFTLDGVETPEYDLEVVTPLGTKAARVERFLGDQSVEDLIRKNLFYGSESVEFPTNPNLVRGFLRHAEMLSVDWLPRWVRTDREGNDYFSVLEGPLLGVYAPGYAVSTKTAELLGNLQASLHNLGISYEGPESVVGAVGPCHFDFGTGNIVVLEQSRLGLIDLDYLSFAGNTSATGETITWEEDVTTSLRQLYISRRHELSPRAIAKVSASFINGYNHKTQGPIFDVERMLETSFHEVGRSFCFIAEPSWQAQHPGKYDFVHGRLHELLDWLQGQGRDWQALTADALSQTLDR